jgi:AcrR family transcriptional regulator
MPTKTDRPYHHGNLKQELIDTALEMIEKEGPESITMRELAKRLDTSRTAPYRHYDSKEALLTSALFLNRI